MSLTILGDDGRPAMCGTAGCTGPAVASLTLTVMAGGAPGGKPRLYCAGCSPVRMAVPPPRLTGVPVLAGSHP